jgi:DNA-binding CsgD family transcriptional regulator
LSYGLATAAAGCRIRFSAGICPLAGPLLTSLPHEQILLRGEIAARYGMALPGGLIAAWGLRRQAYHAMGHERLARTRPPISITRVALAAFAVFGGLVGPAAPFFPANWINQEMRVLSQVAEGKTNREIAEVLFLGEGTVRNYVSSILNKLNLTNRAEAAAYAVRHNLKGFL